MDEQPGEPGWWQASDLKWYPPEAAPGWIEQPSPADVGPVDDGQPPGVQRRPGRFRLLWARRPVRVATAVIASLLLIGLIASAVDAASLQNQRNDLRHQLSAMQDDRDQVRVAARAADTERRATEARLQGEIAAANHRADTAEARALTDAKNKLANQVHDTGLKLDARKTALDARQHSLDDRSHQLDTREAAVAAAEGNLHANSVSGDGVYAVGSEMQPGVWHTAGASGCYYAILNSTDTFDIADNNNTDGPATVTLAAGKYFDVTNCADWVKVG